MEKNGETSTQTKLTGKQDIDWGRFGLSETSNRHNRPSNQNTGAEYVYDLEKKEDVKELFEDEQEQQSETETNQPWWKSSFFVTSKLLFGTWDGVFTSCVMNMVGVVVFLRSGWMVGYAGIGLSLLVVIISFLLAFATVMSAVGICDRCHIGKGGVYFIITHVLGGKIGGAIGLLYCFGHATATALYCTGFAESLVELANWKSAWSVRCVSIITLFVMLSIVISGVKWIIRFQLLLIVILALAMMDFIIGTLVQDKPEAGFTGFSNYNFLENLNSEFTDDISFFVVLGVFFPSACGVMAGINMSGDLKDPDQNIPEGSVAGLGVCGALYTIIVLFLGSTCTRVALQTDYMIMEKISIVGALVIFGLFVAALSSTLGGLVGPPRVLQSIAEDDVLPILKPFVRVKGVNEEPHNATLLVAAIAFVFLFVGNLNTLAPIVTMPFLTTYSAINYAYFAMAMSYDLLDKDTTKESSAYGAIESDPMQKMNAMKVITDDVDRVLKEKEDEKHAQDNNLALMKRQDSGYTQIVWIQQKQPNEFYAKVCNRWVSLMASLLCFMLSFCISWVYALSNLVLTLLLYIFISQSRPGLSRGVANNFSLSNWIISICTRGQKREYADQVVVHNHGVPYGISMYQVTEDNTDYDHRDKKHHSAPVTNPISYIKPT